MSKMQTANQPALSRRAIRTRLLLTLIYAALVPYPIYRVGNERYHLSAVNALLLAALSPAVGSRGATLNVKRIRADRHALVVTMSQMGRAGLWGRRTTM